MTMYGGKKMCVQWNGEARARGQQERQPTKSRFVYDVVVLRDAFNNHKETMPMKGVKNELNSGANGSQNVRCLQQKRNCFS